MYAKQFAALEIIAFDRAGELNHLSLHVHVVHVLAQEISIDLNANTKLNYWNTKCWCSKGQGHCNMIPTHIHFYAPNVIIVTAKTISALQSEMIQQLRSIVATFMINLIFFSTCPG